MATSSSGTHAPFIDNPHAPEIFAERAASFLILNGNVYIKILCASIRLRR